MLNFANHIKIFHLYYEIASKTRRNLLQIFDINNKVFFLIINNIGLIKKQIAYNLA